ncbi:transglutaminase-like domain-containing protein [Verminephrobacter aporrectodeae]|uniref:transglutaminase-like domain-containing protein n=1 Tax=Verminephrobacter aporrectodeae TaxID=1110389 RepID=UPI0022381629|nr:transglutaminase domain-containing protein [Verminephrobacter aporrectodeae]
MSTRQQGSIPAGLARRSILALPLAGLLAPVPGVAHAECDARRCVLRHLRFFLKTSNPLDRALLEQRLWCYLPANLAGQRVVQTHVSVPHQIYPDALGHLILELSFDRFPPFAHKIVTIDATLALNGSERRQELAAPREWLAAERFIESDHPQIGLLARQLGRSTPALSARAIFEWVQGNIRYAGYLAEDRGALQALLTSQGDCTEYADLVVALCRALGIPARMVGGYVVDGDAVVLPQDYHNWAEVFWDGQWQVVDAQKGDWLGASAHYVVFRIYRDVASNPVGLAHRFRISGDLKATL